MNRFKHISLLLVVASLLLASCKNDASVEWIYSTNDSPWTVSELVGSTSEADENSKIEIYPSREEQTIDGFGGCFNELGWEALNIVSEEEKEAILKALFDTISGCKFNKCRMPIGANDYALDWYSYDEVPGDLEMKHFSIERDKKRLVPYIKSAQAYNPNIKVWGSPWCPPSWMKTNMHYACKPDSVNDLPEEGRGIEEGSRAKALPLVSQFRMEDPYLSAYALYFSKYIDAYQQEGIDIYAVHVQNEPNSCQIFPSCIWVPKDLARFIGDHLGPKLAETHPEVEIWLGTIERPQIERIEEIIEYPNVKQYIKGIGFQWGGKGAIKDAHATYPDLQLMQTETECGNGSNDWAAAEHTYGLMKHYFNNGANAYLYWNMVLDETGKSQWGWKQNSMISIDRTSKEITYNPEFYLMKHFSAFIELGAKKVETSDDSCLAFKNKKSIVVVYYNDGEAKSMKFNIDEKEFTADLKAKSFNTFKVSL
jgi:glucosylceramidase